MCDKDKDEIWNLSHRDKRNTLGRLKFGLWHNVIDIDSAILKNSRALSYHQTADFRAFMENLKMHERA